MILTSQIVNLFETAVSSKFGHCSASMTKIIYDNFGQFTPSVNGNFVL